MPRQQTDRRSATILPIRLDGEPVDDPADALPLPPDFRPWEVVVIAHLAARAGELRHAA